MAKIEKFDAATARTLGARIEQALKAIADECGVSITMDRMRYAATRASVTLEIGTIGADGSVASREAEAFRAYAAMYCMEPSDLGREFVIGNAAFVLTGANPRAHKRPIVARKVSDGRTYVFPSDVVARALGKVQIYPSKEAK